MLDYFSFARAKKNKADLEKTNPKTPVLNDEDEQFLQKVTTEESAPPLPPTVISDGGQEEEVQSEEQAKEAEAAGTVALPTTPSRDEAKSGAAEAPAQESGDKDESKETGQEDESSKVPEVKAEEEPKEVQGSGVTVEEKQEVASQDSPQQAKRTWASYVPAMPALPAVSVPTWSSKSKDTTTASGTKDAATKNLEGVSIKEDVKLDQEGKETDDEKEVSVLLDRLNLSSINNRVFSFSKQSQKIYEDFTIVLKDMINGAPTAYEDMEKLLKENEGHLSEMFGNMPPFVQTLVKSLPARLGSTLGPEMLAAASSKPGADMKTRMATASKSESSGESATVSTTASGKQKKDKVPTLKGLVSEQGAVAGMLKSIVNFLKLRFPWLISGTNVVMSLAVFILLLVFWYCHKRGKETRLLREGEKADDEEESEDEDLVEKGEDDQDVEEEEDAEAEEEEGEQEAEAEAEDDGEAEEVVRADAPEEESAVSEPEKKDVKEVETSLHG